MTQNKKNGLFKPFFRVNIRVRFPLPAPLEKQPFFGCFFVFAWDLRGFSAFHKHKWLNNSTFENSL